MSRFGSTRVPNAVLGLALLAALGCSPGGGERDYLLAPHRPNLLAVVDAKDREVVRVHELSGSPPITLVPTRDGTLAYVAVDRSRRITGVDIDTGDEVFRADLGEGAERVTTPGAMALRPGGKELFVFVHPVEIRPDRYVVRDTRVAVYDTAAGLEAKAIRSFPVERRTAVLAFSPDGSRLYAFSWDIVAYDPDTGEELERIPVTSWVREGWGAPDYLDAWPAFELTDIWVSPFTAMKGDVLRLGVLHFDLAEGALRTVDVEEAGTLIFSMAVNPARPAEAFGAYTTLSKINLDTGALEKRIDLDHTYYNVQVSSDGSEIFVGGTMDDIGVYDSADLRKLDQIFLPSGNDQGLGTLRIVRRARLE
jgi:quinohemoprotein amine dehydrogenase beta subunit